MEQLTKVCSKCGIEKTKSEYRSQPNGKLGVRADCKSCNKLYKKTNADIIKEKNAAYYAAKKPLTLKEKCAILETENEELKSLLAEYMDYKNSIKGDR
jgi:hypothetical protein